MAKLFTPSTPLFRRGSALFTHNTPLYIPIQELYLLMEDSDFMLLEDGSNAILENSVSA